MRGVKIGQIQFSAAPFLAEPEGPYTLLPGGVTLDAEAFGGMEVVPAGTAIGRTYEERDAGAAVGPVAVENGAVVDDEVFLIAYDVRLGTDGNEAVLVKPGATVFEDRLPGFYELDDAVKAALRARYTMITSA